MMPRGLGAGGRGTGVLQGPAYGSGICLLPPQKEEAGITVSPSGMELNS